MSIQEFEEAPTGLKIDKHELGCENWVMRLGHGAVGVAAGAGAGVVAGI